MFENARLKLTAWYLLIIMTISLLFSFVIYSSINTEFRRFEKFQVLIHPGQKERFVIPLHQLSIPVQRYDEEMIQEARKRLVFSLGIINLTILGMAGMAGYFLAGRTLRPIQKMVDEQKRFITDASHELRTPLTSLRSEIEVGLRNKKLSLSAAQKLLSSNLEEVVSLQTLSDNLLELAQNGKVIDPQHMTNVSLSDSIADAVKKVQPLAKKKQITIKQDIQEEIVVGIQDRLTEVFVILLDNAIKYSTNKSIITLSSKLDRHFITVSVNDQGIGIGKKDLQHIFDRFYRADTSRSKTAGYGLGLSIAQKVVLSHSGFLTVESDIKKGTTFFVKLPRKV